jgi:Protein of unknown function (DUF3429)
MTPSDISHDPDPHAIPAAAAILGAGGLAPFLGLLAAPILGAEPFGRPPLAVLAIYAAVILAFMGAVHWGLSMAGYGGRRDTSWRYAASVVPALLAWFSVAFLPLSVALGVMAGVFALLLLYDLRSSRIGTAPPWYARLRWRLTAVVVPCLLAASVLT